MAHHHQTMNPPQSPKTATSQSLHDHRLNHNPSKLPAFRFGDLKKRLHLRTSVPPLLSPESAESAVSPGAESAQASPYATLQQGTTSPGRDNCQNTTLCAPIAPSSPPKKPSTSPDRSNKNPQTSAPYLVPAPLPPHPAPVGSVVQRVQDKRSRRAPASHSSNGIETFTGPPPALSTQRSFAADSAKISTNPTTEWALAQQELALQSINGVNNNTPVDQNHDQKSTIKPTNPPADSKFLDVSASSSRRIPPIRSFRSSATRASLEMAAKSPFRFDGLGDDQENDRDATLRALEGGFSDEERREQRLQMEEDQHRRRLIAEPSSEDLFLNLARDDQSGDASTGTRRRSRIALASHRQSLPPQSSTFQSSGMTPIARRGSDLQGRSPSSELQSTYGRDRTIVTSPTSQVGLSRTRYTPTAPQSASTSTPSKTVTPREPSFQSALSYGGRRTSVPDANATTPQRLPGYRQSNLTYGSSRVYNSSPLVGRTMEAEDDGPETPRAAEGTESTASTTAPSTVWDELDDLKSRIRKLELTGKLPLTSGAAVSHATGDRPPTATTTITTMSTSPKRGRGLSASPIDSTEAGPPTGEIHPLLHSALAKSKSLLSSEVYKALEATASDALAIAAMMGTAGQPGPISSSQSTIGGGNPGATDRQLRRKADSMCRSLTELCLALSEEPTVQPPSQALVRTISRERDYQQESPRTADSLSRFKPSPRSVSRQEARRSSLMGNSSLPSPRFISSGVNNDGPSTPSQSNFSSRRTSLLIRNRRAGTEELEEEEPRFRAPSRATTDIGRIRNSPREYTSREEPPPLPLQDNRTGSVQSSLPVRRHFASSSLNGGQNSGAAQMQMRYLDRSTPERNTTSVASKLAEERGQRAGSLEPRSSVLGRTGSLGRQRLVPRASEAVSNESSTIGAVGGHQRRASGGTQQ